MTQLSYRPKLLASSAALTVAFATLLEQAAGRVLDGNRKALICQEAEQQFAEADALTWHAGEWNTDGPGIEFERLHAFEEVARGLVGDDGGDPHGHHRPPAVTVMAQTDRKSVV